MGDVTLRVGLGFFCLRHLPLDPNPKDNFLRRKSVSVEPLYNFLAFGVNKLWPKIHKINKQKVNEFPGDILYNLLLLDHNFQTPTLEINQGSKEADFWLVFFWKKKQKIAPWCWAPGPSECGPNKSINHPFCDVTHKKLKSKASQFFLIETRRLPESLEGWTAV